MGRSITGECNVIIKIEIIHENEQGETSKVAFTGNDLTSAVSEAVEYFKEKQQKEMVV